MYKNTRLYTFNVFKIHFFQQLKFKIYVTEFILTPHKRVGLSVNI